MSTTTIWDGLGVFAPSSGNIMEVRVLFDTPKGRNFSGYFDALDLAAQAVEQAAATYTGNSTFYATINPVHPDTLTRGLNRLKPFATSPATDAEILRRAYFLIDCDPVRLTGISSTEEELALGLALRDDCRRARLAGRSQYLLTLVSCRERTEDGASRHPVLGRDFGSCGCS